MLKKDLEEQYSSYSNQNATNTRTATKKTDDKYWESIKFVIISIALLAVLLIYIFIITITTNAIIKLLFSCIILILHLYQIALFRRFNNKKSFGQLLRYFASILWVINIFITLLNFI